MSRRTLLCEKLTGDTRSLKIMDRFTGTILAIPAQHPGLTCSRKRTLFASTVLAAVITVTAKYLSFVGGQSWPAMPLVSCQHEAMAAPTCARAGSQLGTDHAPLIFLCTATELEADRGQTWQSSNTWKQQQLDYIFF